MRIQITDAHNPFENDLEMIVSSLQGLLDALYPALMNDLDRNGCRDFLYNYASPSFVHHMDDILDDDGMASCLMTFVVQNDGFPMDEDDPAIEFADVLEAIDTENECFFVKATLGK